MTTTKYIEIRDSTDKPVAFLSPQADGLRADTAYIDNELNGNCSLTFELPTTSKKWQYITDAYEFLVDGKRFILLKPDTEEVVRDGKKVWGKVTAQEKWVEMDKQYVTVSNDPDFPTPDWSVVRIGNGTPAGGYPTGSAGSALTYLLVGSGWTLLTCDVTGSFELITEKISRLANIQKVQELWGGNFFWDSENKTVSLRDETLYQNYTGFQVRYAKNLKGITRTVNRDLVTRLYPFGKEDLSIGAVNGGVIYLDNNTHTSKVYEGQWVNQDITDATELKTKAIVELAKLCKPRYTYSITMLDLSVKPQWAHETFSNGDMADVIDLDVGVNDRARITRHKYNIFQKWKCELTVGEPLEKLASRIADTSAVTEKILANTGTSNLLKAIINTKATEINGASGDYSCIDGVSTWWGSTGGVRNGKVTRITPNGLIISDDGAQSWRTAIDGSGIYGDKLIVSDAYAISSDDGYTKMGSAGISVMDGSDVVKAFLGQYATGKFGLKLYDGDIEITSGLNKTILNATDGFKIQKLVNETWTDQFYVDSSGNVVYKGTLSGATGTFSGTVSAGTITGSTITGGSINIGSGNFIVNSAGGVSASSLNITGGSISLGDNFGVTSDGTVTAISGSIGGWTISADAIYRDGATDAVSSGMASGDYPFYAGKKYANRDTAPFRVTQAGAFVATDADITGKFTVKNSSGVILAELKQFSSGVLDGGQLKLYNNSARNTVTLDSASEAGEVLIYTGDSNNFLGIKAHSEDDYNCLTIYHPYSQHAAIDLDVQRSYDGAFFSMYVPSTLEKRVYLSSRINEINYIVPALCLGTTVQGPGCQLTVEGQTKLNGNTGIGCSPGIYPLSVAGDINCTGAFRSNGTAGVSGTYTTINSITFTGGIVTAIS